MSTANDYEMNAVLIKQGHQNAPSNATRLSSWWWWEIIAVLFSMSCMMASVVLLAKLNNTRLSAWSLYLQPNTILSILTTGAKSAMLLSVSTCLSQLKWSHFSCRPTRPGGPLSHLQDFDEASRGPWGSLLILGNFHLVAVMPATLALITVASLAIDPMAQQVLKFPSRETSLHNLSAGIGQASGYSLKFDNPPANFADDPQPWIDQAQVLESLAGTKLEPQYNCPSPATKCSWDDFSSLGICGTFQNVTDTASFNCTMADIPSPQSLMPLVGSSNITRIFDKFVNTTCNISSPDMYSKPLTMSWYTGRTNALAPSVYDIGHYDLVDSKVEGAWDDYTGSHDYHRDIAVSEKYRFSGLYAKLLVARTVDHQTIFNITETTNYNSTTWQLPLHTELLQASWYFCEHIYSNVSVDLGTLSVGHVTKNPLNLFSWDNVRDRSTNNGSIYTFHSNTTGLNYTVADRDGWADTTLALLLGGLHLGYTPFIRQENGESSVSPTYTRSASNDMIYSLESTTRHQTLSNIPSTPPSDLARSLSVYLNSADLEALSSNLANTLTARIRRDMIGGNSNLTMLPGQAFRTEAYITVQWPWMILPLLEIVLAAVALAVMIASTRKQALLKGSTLALLMQQMDGWEPEERHVRRLDTYESLYSRSQTMYAVIQEGSDNEMLFKRQFR